MIKRSNTSCVLVIIVCPYQHFVVPPPDPMSSHRGDVYFELQSVNVRVSFLAGSFPVDNEASPSETFSFGGIQLSGIIRVKVSNSSSADVLFIPHKCL